MIPKGGFSRNRLQSRLLEPDFEISSQSYEGRGDVLQYEQLATQAGENY